MSSALDRFFADYYRHRPVNATFTGVHAFDDRLPDWSPEGLDIWASEMDACRAALAGPTAGCLPAERVDVALADAFLEIQVAEVVGGHFYRRNPALFTGEALFSILGLVTRPFAPATQRLAAVRARLDALPRFLADARRTVTAPIPGSWKTRAVRECEAAERFLAVGLPQYVAAVAPAWEGAVPRGCFSEFATWLAREAPMDDGGARKSLGCGAEMFELLLRRGHGEPRSLADLRREIDEELARAADRLQTLARVAGLDGWPAVQAALVADHPALDDYLSAFHREWHRCRDAALAANLVTWPDAPLCFVPIPEHTRDQAPDLYYLFYRSPAPFDDLPVHEVVVTPVDDAMPPAEQRRRLEAHNFAAIRANYVIHHAGLGHHVQNAYARRAASRVGQVAAVDCASRIGMFSGGTMAEGWACYAVDLMEDIGVLAPLERIQQQHTRLRLLARARLDLGIHCEEWSEEAAVRFWRDTVSASPEASLGETTRASMFPGTAIMYWLGTRAIHDLRARVAARAGQAFSLRAFHDAFLAHGSIPVPMIAASMLGEEWP